MPLYPRSSPNAVIHDWLSRAEAGPRPARHASSSKRKRSSRAKHHHRRLRDGEDDLQPRGSVHQTTERMDGERILREAENLHLPASIEHDAHQLAQRLGLRTPFRDLDGNQRKMQAKEASAMPTGKRKRSPSPSSPRPRPRDGRRSLAEADDRERLTCSSLVGRAADPNRSIAKSRLHPPEFSTAALKSSKIIAKPYERKRRFKTREDHYTLKEARKVPKQTINEGESPVRKRGKRTRKEKSGSALMHDFTARNVAFSRLTLPSAPVVGIFCKGRASSPVKRMGLPDLAFSEVSFLKSRRDKPKDPNKPLERSSGRGKGGFTHDDAVISRYFTSTKDSLPHRLGSELDLSPFSKHRCHGREEAQFPQKRCSIKEKTVLPLLELPETPFLGFGSSGFSISSPGKLRTPLKTPRRTTHSPAQLMSSTRSTTYFTWSRSGAVSRGSLPPDSASNLSPRSWLSNESQHHRAPTGHVHAMRHDNVQVECPPGHDDAPRESEAILPGVEDQARISDIGRGIGQVHQPISSFARSDEPPDENRNDDNGKTLKNIHNQEFSANSSTKTSLAEKTLVASLDLPFISCRPSSKNNASLNSFNAAADGLNHRCRETPSRKIINSRYQTAVHSDAKEKEADGQVWGHAGTPGDGLQDIPVPLADPTSDFGPSSPPSAPTMQPPPTLFNQSRPISGSSSSMAWLKRNPQSYEYELHRVSLPKTPIPRTYLMRQSPLPGANAWHGYDNMYERQEIDGYDLSCGSTGNMQGYTPVKIPESEKLIVPKGRFARSYHGLNPYRCREKLGFQQPEEYSSASGNLLDQYSKNLRGTSYRYINSPACYNLAANVSDKEEGEPQAYDRHSHDERFGAADDARLHLGQKSPLQRRFDFYRRPWDLATQDPLFEPYVGSSPHTWSQATPSHTPRSRRGFIESSKRPRLDQDESQLADFWKPNLLY